jgi:hypothetical protein
MLWGTLSFIIEHQLDGYFKGLDKSPMDQQDKLW